MPKILGGEAWGRKKVRMATKWDRRCILNMRQRLEAVIKARGGSTKY